MGYDGRMTRPGHVLAAAIALCSAAPAAADEEACELCALSARAGAERPLQIEIENGLQFSRLALRGQYDGAAELDPHTGEKRVDAGMIDLGGMSYQGRARVTGEPLRPVRIELPQRVQLRSADGAEAELTGFVTDLPPVAMLDGNGVLEFNFGARLSSQGARGGSFRGRIAIRVDYF
jgi:hypothetical protein